MSDDEKIERERIVKFIESEADRLSPRGKYIDALAMAGALALCRVANQIRDGRHWDPAR